MDVSYDNDRDCFQGLGFNKFTIDQLKPYFSSLEGFVDYDAFAIIERFEAIFSQMKIPRINLL